MKKQTPVYSYEDEELFGWRRDIKGRVLEPLPEQATMSRGSPAVREEVENPHAFTRELT